MGEELASLLDFVLGLLADYGLDDFYLELSTKPPGKAVGTDEEWEEATEALRQVASDQGPRARARRGRRCVLRAEDLRAGPRRHRSHVADVDDPARLPDAAALRDRVRRRRQRAAPADHDPPRPVRVDRALLRRARRALRRRLPGLARRPSRCGCCRCAATTTPTRPASSTGCRPTASAPSLVEADEPLGAPHPQGQAGEAAVHPRGGRQRRRGRHRGRQRPRRRPARARRRTSTPSSSGWPPRSWPRPDPCRSTTSGPPGARPTSAASSTRAPSRRPRRPAGRTLFERILAGADEEGDEAAGVLWRGATCFALLNLYPYTAGHLMVLPQPGGGRARGPHRRRARRAVGGGARGGRGAEGGVRAATRSTSG